MHVGVRAALRIRPVTNNSYGVGNNSNNDAGEQPPHRIARRPAAPTTITYIRLFSVVHAIDSAINAVDT